METNNRVDQTKRAKNIVAILYLLVLSFLVVGSYINQQRKVDGQAPNQPVSAE
ncbi:MAG: hypothetical protein ACU836_16095 [Gammaproteobacteria bacterium]